MYKVTYTYEGKYRELPETEFEFTFTDLIKATEYISKCHINARENDLQVGRDYNITFTEEV